jgi:hypothetical protein
MVEDMEFKHGYMKIGKEPRDIINKTLTLSISPTDQTPIHPAPSPHTNKPAPRIHYTNHDRLSAFQCFHICSLLSSSIDVPRHFQCYPGF